MVVRLNELHNFFIKILSNNFTLNIILSQLPIFKKKEYTRTKNHINYSDPLSRNDYKIKYKNLHLF